MTSPTLIGYADCFSGISGDMFLGAVLHCGMPEELLRDELAKLKIDGYQLSISSRRINGIGSTKVDVLCEKNQEFRHLSKILDLLHNSNLDDRIISYAEKVFIILAQAEAKVHDIELEKVHFHEVGALDTIIDIVGSIAGLTHLGIEKLYSSPLPSPHGFVHCSHGMLPLPAPAVCEILEGVPCYGVNIEHELVTPTGAALIKGLASGFGHMVPMTIKKTGYGAGSTIREKGLPNLFRLITGEAVSVNEKQEVEVIETNLDDWSPEGYPHLCDKLFDAGALDVNLTPIHMKKGRPGFKLQVISSAAHSAAIKNTLFRETTSIGLRFRKEHRVTLEREHIEVTTPWGRIQAKKVTRPDGDIIYPEYEECRKLALQHGIALGRVYDAVKKAGLT